ncbi:MAG: DUF4157 domain-containing protein [Streptosporangiaceae bacterium]
MGAAPVWARPATVPLWPTPVGPQVQRCGGVHCPPGTCGHDQGETARRSGDGTPGPAQIPASVAKVLDTPGQALDASTRSDLEERLGHDFGQVRVHTDAQAAQSAHAVHAQAYTIGRHIVMGQGRYQPHTASGTQLLIHELIHVVQQGNPAADTGPARTISDHNDPSEREADQVTRTLTGPSGTPASRGVLQRQHATLANGIHQALASPGPPLRTGHLWDAEARAGVGDAAARLMRQTTTSPGMPGGPDPCMEIFEQIVELLNEVAQRINDALDDPHDLFKDHRNVKDAHPDYGSWDGHRDRYYYDRDRLREKLAEWDGNDDCRGRRIQEQQQQEFNEAKEYAEKEYPERPAKTMREAPEPDPSTRERIADALREAGVPAWAVAGLVVLVIAALADPEPFTKVAALIGTAAAIAIFALIGHHDAVPGDRTTASTEDDGGVAAQPPESTV